MSLFLPQTAMEGNSRENRESEREGKRKKKRKIEKRDGVILYSKESPHFRINHFSLFIFIYLFILVIIIEQEARESDRWI